jgi:shikimate kinase
VNKNIVLIGPMGSGKTSVGRRLSCILKKDFFDTDFEIVSRTGVSIEHIFDVEGEEGFRKRETKVLSDLLKIPNLVIATGGGIVVRDENLELLKNSIVIYLRADIDTLLERCLKSKARPLINNSTDKKQTITDIFNARKNLYEKSADFIVDVGKQRLYSIINEIKEKIKNT